MRNSLRLGINIDHVATVRNARGGTHPDPLRAALLAKEAGADGITMHLREDRRHIRDADVELVKQKVALPLNFEMAATDEMVAIALRVKPHAVCIVPEKRAELTTEGGLNVVGVQSALRSHITQLKQTDIRISLFVNADLSQLDAAKELGADIVELHTGHYCDASGQAQQAELERIQKAATYATKIGLECHAGHGLSYDNVKPIAAIQQIVELNIGHFLIGEAILVGLKESIQQMRKLMNEARA